MRETTQSRRAPTHPHTPTPEQPRHRSSLAPRHKALDAEERSDLLGHTLLALSAAHGRRISCAELVRATRSPGRPRKRTRPASRRELERLLYRQRRAMAKARQTGQSRAEARHRSA